ncbi:MAG: DUF4440 domain-containing protein [bacterium]|nr:DUF4440 domain-containing protein [bacterium]
MESILEELTQLEPLIYAANDGKTRAYFENLLIADFWEVGASGKVYERDFVLATLAQRQEQPREELWRVFDCAVRQIEAEHFLFTYALEQPTRISRRASLWKRTPEGWQLVYHQGTPVL